MLKRTMLKRTHRTFDDVCRPARSQLARICGRPSRIARRVRPAIARIQRRRVAGGPARRRPRRYHGAMNPPSIRQLLEGSRSLGLMWRARLCDPVRSSLHIWAFFWFSTPHNYLRPTVWWNRFFNSYTLEVGRCSISCFGAHARWHAIMARPCDKNVLPFLLTSPTWACLQVPSEDTLLSFS